MSVQLPPLPPADLRMPGLQIGAQPRSFYTSDQMRAYALSAVEAERMAVDAAYEALQLSGEVSHYIGKARRILAAAIRARGAK